MIVLVSPHMTNWLLNPNITVSFRLFTIHAPSCLYITGCA